MTGVTTRRSAGGRSLGYEKVAVGCGLMTIVEKSYQVSVITAWFDGNMWNIK
jgi:hypothetical protein